MGAAIGWFLVSLALCPGLVLIHELGHAFATVLLTGHSELISIAKVSRVDASLASSGTVLEYFLRSRESAPANEFPCAAAYPEYAIVVALSCLIAAWS